MADYLDFMDPDLRDAYQRAALSRQQSRSPEIPPTGMTPEEETTWLGRRLDEGLGGLSYLGKLADKYFGARAVRGGLNMLAGGDTPTSELFSMLPLSDTLGLTSEKNVAQGTDLLANLGLTTKGDDDWQNQLAGFGVELLTDPSTYVGIGPLTKAGMAAKRGVAGAGTLAPKLSERIAQGQSHLLDVGVPLGSLFGLERVGVNPFGQDASAAIARNFLKPATVPANALGVGLEKYVGTPVEKILGVNPFTMAAETGRAAYRQGKALFHQPSQGATSVAGQDVAENVLTPAYNRLADNVNRAAADAAVDISRIAGGDALREQEIERFLTRAVETPNLEEQAAKLEAHQAFFANQPISGQQVIRRVEQAMNAPGGTEAERLNNVKAALDRTALAQETLDKNMDHMRLLAAETQREAERAGPEAAKWQTIFTPDEMQTLGQHADRLAAFNREWLDAVRAGGGNTPDILDITANYMFRQKGVLPKQPGEKIIPYLQRVTGEFNARKDFMKERLDEFRNIPGGTDRLNELVKDPYLSGPNRTAPSDLAAETKLIGILTGQPATRFTADSAAAVQAKKLAELLHGMEPVYAKEGRDFYQLDFAGRLKQRGDMNAKVQATQDAVYYGIGKYAQPKDTFPVGQSMSVPDLLNELKLNRQSVPEAFPDSWTLARDAVKNRLGPINVADVQNLHVPADLARDILKFGRAWTQPEEMKPVMQAWSMMANLFKTGVTALFPAFHSRNLMSALFNSWRDDALSLRGLNSAQRITRGGFMDEKMAAKLYPGLSAENATHELMKELIGTDTAFTGAGRRGGEASGALANAEQKMFHPPALDSEPESLKDMASRWFGGLLPTNTKLPTIRKEYSPFGIKGVGETEDVNILIKRAREVQRSIEDTVRTAHYTELRLQGVPVEEAAARVKKYHNDYNPASFTEFENKWAKSLVPWYSFCVPETYEILTREGWKQHWQLRIGEDCLSLDHETGEMKWCPVEAINVFDHDGPLTVMEGRSSKFLCTSNHNWPTVTVDTFVKGKQYGGQKALTPAYKLSGYHKIPRTGEFHGIESVLSPRHAAILGWVVTDGTFRWRGNHCEMVIYQSEKKFVRQVEGLVGNVRRRAHDNRRDRTNGGSPTAPVHTVPVRLEDVKVITAVFRSKADLPSIVGKLSREAAESMFDAMMMAEGSMSETGQQSFGQSIKNSAVRDAFQMLCYLTGRSANLRDHGAYVQRVKYMKVTDWKKGEEHYTGKVWCPTTMYGTWVMRHNGQACITGNSRRNLPPILEDLASNPGKITGALRLTSGVRDPSEFVPAFIGEGASIPIPGGPDGQQRYISSFGLPIEDELLKLLGSASRLDVQRTLQQGIGMANPLVKLPFEQAFGTQLYSGRKLQDIQPSQFMSLGGLIPDDVARGLTEVAANSPLSRMLTTADRFVDSRKGTLPTVTNLLTGLHVSDVDAARQQDIAARELVKKALRGEKEARVREEVYVPLEKRADLDPTERFLLSLMQSTNQRVVDASKAEKERKAAGGR